MGIRSYLNSLNLNNDSAENFYDNFTRTTIKPGLGSGGSPITSGNIAYSVFTTPGTFTVTENGFFEFIVIAGGGGGGTGTGGGGGAGGVVHAPSIYLSSPLSITIGSGAAPASHPNQSNSGNPSTVVGQFGTITAVGGGKGSGGGSGGLVNSSATGGSGGGGSSYSSPPYSAPGSATIQPSQNPGIPSIFQYGNNGGTFTDANGGGGGGGAGAAGSNGPNGPGGAGRAFPSFPAPVIAPAIPAPVRSAWSSAVGPTGLFAGGGGGSSPTGGSGGPGGGGNAAPSGGAGSGVEYTGSGGGANWTYTPGFTAGGGGSGIVIVKYVVSA